MIIIIIIMIIIIVIIIIVIIIIIITIRRRRRMKNKQTKQQQHVFIYNSTISSVSQEHTAPCCNINNNTHFKKQSLNITYYIQNTHLQ